MPKLSGGASVDPREELALEFARRFASEPGALDDGFMARMRERFSDAEMVELGLVTGAFLMLGRLHRAFGVAPMGPDGHAVLRKG